MRLDDRENYSLLFDTLKMTEDYDKILGVKHKGNTKENEHYHFVFYTQVKFKAFRARMVKMFDKGKGNAHMSIKPFDGNEDALSYLFHEGGDPVINKGFAPEDIARFRIRNEKVQDEVKKAKGKASFLLEEIVYEECKNSKERFTCEEIAFKIYRNAFDGGKYLPNDYQIKGMVDKIMFRLCDTVQDETAFINSLVRRVYKKEW